MNVSIALEAQVLTRDEPTQQLILTNWYDFWRKKDKMMISLKQFFIEQ